MIFLLLCRVRMYATFATKRRYMEKLPGSPLYFGARNQAK